MKNWYSTIINDPDNYDNILSAYDYYETQYLEAKNSIPKKGNVQSIASKLPGMVEERYSQLQELEAILSFLELKERQIKHRKLKDYLEHYKRALTDRMAEKYADGDDEVIIMKQLQQQIALIRNKFLSIMKALDVLNWQLSNIVKLRVAGCEDAIM